MGIAITLPPLGGAISQARVARWLVRPGTQVRAGQPVVTVISGSTETDVESPVSGRLKSIRHDAGGTAAIGDVLGELE